MIPALFILGFTVLVGLVLYIGELHWRKKHPKIEENKDEMAEEVSVGSPKEPGQEFDENSEECCGLHLVCEKDSLSPMSDEILYYDDEELDRFIGRTPDSYTPEEEEEFREVLMTLRPEDAAGWARSITQRRLELPHDVRDALLIIVNEQRQSAN